MTIWQLTDYDVEAVVTQLEKGKTFQEVAEDLGFTVEMVVCAARKWPRMRRNRGWGAL